MNAYMNQVWTALTDAGYRVQDAGVADGLLVKSPQTMREFTDKLLAMGCKMVSFQGNHRAIVKDGKGQLFLCMIAPEFLGKNTISIQPTTKTS